MANEELTALYLTTEEAELFRQMQQHFMAVQGMFKAMGSLEHGGSVTFHIDQNQNIRKIESQAVYYTT